MSASLIGRLRSSAFQTIHHHSVDVARGLVLLFTAIVRMIENGPTPAIHGVVRWRLIDLSQWIYEEFRITVAKQTLSRGLRAMGYRKLSARPRHHGQAGAIENFKKIPSAPGPARY